MLYIYKQFLFFFFYINIYINERGLILLKFNINIHIHIQNMTHSLSFDNIVIRYIIITSVMEVNFFSFIYFEARIEIFACKCFIIIIIAMIEAHICTH